MRITPIFSRTVSTILEPLLQSRAQQKILCIIGLFFCALCTVPMFKILYLVQNIGANNLSNDYLTLMPAVYKILHGNYNWANIFVDAQLADHFIPITLLLHIFCAKYFAWNTRCELYIGSLLSLIRVFLIYGILCGIKPHKPRLFLLGGIFAFVFSMSQTAIFLYGEATLPVGLSALGFALALFSVVKVENVAARIFITIFGGLLSSYSWGNVIPCWICLFFALALFHRTKKEYIFAAVATVLSIAPYRFLLSNRSHDVGSLFYPRHFFNVLGRILCNKIAHRFDHIRTALVSGCMGFVLFLLNLINLVCRRQLNGKVKASLILVLYGLLSAWSVSVMRKDICPWHSTVSANFWIGLLGLIDANLELVYYQSRLRGLSSWKLKEWLALVLAIASIIIITSFYLRTNRTYEDKHFYVESRGFVSEATLRNFRTAPNYCEKYVFQWGDGFAQYLPKLASLLEKYHLSAFADKQEWTLQGEFPLDNVVLHKGLGELKTLWVESNTVTKPASWDSFKRLNLCLANKDSITWTVKLPNNLKSAIFKTAFVLPDHQIGVSNPRVKFKVDLYVTDNSGQTKKIAREKIAGVESAWHSVEIPLSEFKGKEILIALSLESISKQELFGLFQFPKINVVLDPVGKIDSAAIPIYERKDDVDYGNREPSKRGQVSWGFVDPNVKPSNTDLSPTLVRISSADYCFPDISTKHWSRYVVHVNEPKPENQKDINILLLADKTRLNLNDYSHLEIEMSSIIPADQQRILCVSIHLASGESRQFNIPLLANTQRHTYTYDLKVLDLPNKAILDGFNIWPIVVDTKSTKDSIKVYNIRLIHRSQQYPFPKPNTIENINL